MFTNRLKSFNTRPSTQSLLRRNFSQAASPEARQLRKQSHQLVNQPARGKQRIPYEIAIGDKLHGFTVKSIDRIEMFDINAYKLEHDHTGMKYVHLDSSDTDNVFAVLFRTPPDDHTGKPHILEHLATCGSKHYPIRDPFFNMLKRSLNTYMNAWTGSDFTMYPFSTQNPQDFRNLLSVYTDMAFAANLDYFDFRQEGHRVEFKDPENLDAGLEYKGVVYNEMKGVVGDPQSTFMYKLNEHLFDKSQYRFNSGGDPKYITDLTYDDLKTFHSDYYHPTNAHVFTYGDLDFTSHLEFIENQVLNSYDRNTNIQSELVLEDQKAEPIIKQETFMPDQMTEASSQVKFGISYICQELCEDPYEAFLLNILSELLLEGPNSPFYKQIIEGGHAPNFCPGAGFDHSQRQTTFTIGVQGITAEDKDRCEQALIDTLKEVANNGIPKKLFETTLHQVEFASKRTKKHTGLMFISHLVPYAVHGGDPLSLFKIDEFSNKAREDFEKGGLFEGLVSKYLLNNEHHLRMTMVPDTEQADREANEEQEKLNQIFENLTEFDKQQIVNEAAALKLRQDKEQDHSVLPSLTLQDIPRDVEVTDVHKSSIGNVKTFYFDQPTNGISYIRIKANLKNMPARLRQFVPMFSEFLGAIGTKQTKYNEFNDRLLNCSSGINVTLDKFSHTSDFNDLHSREESILISTGFLERNTDRAFECLTELLAHPNFNEQSNIADQMKMHSISKSNAIANNGLEFASSLSASGLRSVGSSFEKLRSNVFYCQFANEMQKKDQDTAMLEDAIKNMQEIAQYLLREENLSISVHSNSKEFDNLNNKLQQLLEAVKNENKHYLEKHSDLIEIPDFSDQTLYKDFFKTPLTVNHCVESLMGPSNKNYKDFGTLMVLSQLMTFHHLLPNVREKGGAYGAGCSINENGFISFYSYRDPNCEATYDNFQKAIKAVSDQKFNELELQEAKLLVFQKLDSVQDPSVKGLVKFTRGLDDEFRRNLRLTALDVKSQDLNEVARKYMLSAVESGKTSRVVFGSQTADFDALQKDKWSVHNPMEFTEFDYFNKCN